MFRHVSASKSMAKAILSGTIKYMIFHVTSKCNARCRMCFNWEGMQHRKRGQDPSLDEVQCLAASMGVLPQLTLSGGEPLLRKDLSEIIRLFYIHAQTRFFTVPTNSLRPDLIQALIDDFTTMCPQGFLNFCLPFHGDAEHYDDIMGVPGNFAKFNESYALIAREKKAHPNISLVLNFVMSKFNFERYQAIIDLALSAYSDIPLGIALCRGLTHEEDATDVPIEAYLNAQQYLHEKKRTRFSINPYAIMFDGIGIRMARRIGDVACGNVRSIKCRAGRRFIVVLDNGDVLPCEMLDSVGIPGALSSAEEKDRPEDSCLGNLKEYNYDMGALLNSDKSRRLIRWIDKHECACTWECAVYSCILHNPIEWAGIALESCRTLRNSWLQQ